MDPGGMDLLRVPDGCGLVSGASLKFMDRVVYGIALAVVSVIRVLPLPVCFALGQAAGALLWAILPGYRRLARENLARAFEGEMPPAAVRRLTFQNFTTLGANACCAFRVAAMGEEEIRRCAAIEGLEHVTAGLNRGKGVVLMISHIGNWELFAQANFHARPYPTGTVYQALRNRRLDDLITRDRRRNGVATFDRKRDLGKAMALLRAGGLVAILVDQHAGDSGVWTPLFRRLSSTSPLAASLATRTGAAVVPMAVFTAGFAKWRISARPEIPYNPDQPDQLTANINRALESQIRESPRDWFWVHNRWKVPHPDFLLARTKRGVYLPADTDPMSLRPFRILIRSSNWLGDAVMSSPAVRAIKAGREDAQVTVLSPKKLADFWTSLPEVDHVIPIEEDASVFSVAWKIRGRFDVAVLFPNSARSALEVWLGGIRRRVGYAGHKREWMLNQVVKEGKKHLRPQHQAAHYMRIADRLGAPKLPLAYPTAPPPTGPLRVGICPGAEYGAAKRWFPIRFRDTMKRIAATVDCEFVIFGVEKDRPVAEDVTAGFQAGTSRVTDLTGRTTLAELIAELRTLRVLVTNDTGTMHLAAALGVPVVAIFGSTEPALTGPLGDQHTVIRHQVECSPCFQRDCPLDFRCMEAVTADEVAAAALERLT